MIKHVNSPYYVLIHLFFLLMAAGPSFATNGPSYLYTVEQITVQAVGGKEQLLLQFKGSYPELPVIDFSPGVLSIFLKSTAVQLTKSTIEFPDSQVFKRVDATQNTNSTLLEFILKSPQWSLENRLTLSQQGSVLQLVVDPTALPKMALDQKSVVSETLTTEVSDRVTKKELLAPPESEALDPAPEVFPEDTGTFATTKNRGIAVLLLVGSLFLILLMLFFAWYAYHRWFPGKGKLFLSGSISIKPVMAYSLGPRQKVVILNLDNRYIACGVTPNHITFLTELSTPEAPGLLEKVRLRHGKIEFDAQQSRAHFMKTVEVARKQAGVMVKSEKGPSSPAPKAEPVYSPTPESASSELPGLERPSMDHFAQALKEKLKTLKPLP